MDREQGRGADGRRTDAGAWGRGDAPTEAEGGLPLSRDTLPIVTWRGTERGHRPLNAPLHLSTVWEAAGLEELADLFARNPDRGFYTRFGHPTIRIAERLIADLEGAEDALLFASGMGAISTSLYAVLRSGDHVVAHRQIFGQTMQLLDRLSSAFGVRVDFVDATDPDVVREAIRPSTRLVYLETPSNPAIDIQDIGAIASIAREREVLVFVDSTFAGPILQRPLELGADLSLQSATKSMGGHADLLAGSCAGSAKLLSRIREMRVLNGPCLDPHACWLLLRGLKTLPLRVRAQSESAASVAAMLDASAVVDLVRYPFLPSHPSHTVARRQMEIGGTMVSFVVRGGSEGARRFTGGLSWLPIASSLGSVHTSLEVPRELDFATDELGERASTGAIPPGLIRLSVGAEAATDIEAEIARGLQAVADSTS